MPTKTHIFFDLDDTLTNSYEYNQQMFVDTFVPYIQEFHVHEQYLRDLHYKSRGISMHTQFKEAIDYIGLNVDPHQLIKENEGIHLNNIHKMSAFEAVEDLLKLLKAKKKTLALLSNRGSGSLTKILEKNCLTGYFDVVISCKEAGHEKPDPYCILELIKKYKISKDKCVLIGDSKTDADFAKNADVDVLVIDHYINNRQFYRVLLETLF